MPIAEKDIKLLWGRAAGHCSNPACRTPVSEIGANGEHYLTGEMAHVVARALGGPRASRQAGPDTYDNLILLCPTCHTKIDKAPEGTYSAELLNSWKHEHEAWVTSWSRSVKFASLEELAAHVNDLLAENKYYFEKYGPHSELAKSNPGSETHMVWVARKLDKLLPNNRKIVAALDANMDLFDKALRLHVIAFIDHATAFEANQYDRVDHYPLFPRDFSDAFSALDSR